MQRKKLVKYYCTDHGWTSANPCMTCDKPTTETVLPARRNDLYYLKDVPTPLPSATSIIKVLAKPGLENWFKTQAAGLAFANPGWSVREVISEMGKNLAAAGKRGERAHDIVSAGAPEEKYEESIMPYVEAYRKFCKWFPHKVEYREKVVYGDGYAGRVDAVVRNGAGDLVILDWKSNNSGLFKETALQLSLYKHAKFLEPEPGASGVPIDWSSASLMGVHLGPNGEFAVKEYKDCFSVAMACKEIYLWQHGE